MGKFCEEWSAHAPCLFEKLNPRAPKKPKYVKFTLPPPKVEVSILSYIYIGLLYIKVKILTSGFQRLAQSVRKIEKSKKKKKKKAKRDKKKAKIINFYQKMRK